MAGTCTSTSEFIRHVEFGLLCVQGNAADRPIMSDVVSMLGGVVSFLYPKQPAFSIFRRINANNKLENPGGNTVYDAWMSSILGLIAF